MLVFPRSPHGDKASDNFLGIAPIRAFSKHIRVALERDQRGCAGRMRRCEQRRWRGPAVGCNENRLATPEIVEHRGNAVGPLLQRRQRARRDRIRRSRARLVEEDEPPERCHRLDPPLHGR